MIGASYLDEDIPHDLAPVMRAAAYDTLSVKDVGNFGLTDARQLFWATERGRTLITYNRKDFVLLHEAIILWARRWKVEAPVGHHGILVLPHLPVPRLFRLIDGLASWHDDIKNRLFLWDNRHGWHEPMP